MTTDLSYIRFRYEHTIGRNDLYGPSFADPVALARGEGDLIYVANRNYEYRPEGVRITICTVDEEYVGEFGRGVPDPGPHEYAEHDGSLVWPSAIALDKEGNVYVADEWLNRISVFSKDGEFLGKWGTPGDGEGQISRPSGLAFDKDDNIYLVDTGNNRVQRFTKGGKFLSKWGRAGSKGGEFNMPWGIYIDRNGNVYIADWRNDRIQKFSPDGNFLMKFGRSGSEEGEFNRPTGVAVDKDGVIYVADWMNNRLQVFDPEGEFIAQRTGDGGLSKWGKGKMDANQEVWQEREMAYDLERERLFYGPIAVEVDDQDRIFVLESGMARMQVYRKIPPFFRGIRL